MQNNNILRNIVALSLIPGLGTQKIRQFTAEPEHIESVFGYGKRKLKTFEQIGEASALGILSFNRWDEVDSLIKKTEQIGAQIITIADERYPHLLKQIYSPPVLFWMKGNAEALNLPSMAVVGTRNPTAYGRKLAEKFSTELVKEGLCIVSGLAYGIDGVAHRIALDAGGKTVAVLGSGIDNLYPKKHSALANDIIKAGGAVITEFFPGAAPDAGNFPVRNRIVSGMSLGVLVVESGVQGGSMITAELGLDQNREIFAVPHSLENLTGSGCNYLIKRGTAKLVQSVDDMLDELSLGREQKNSAEAAVPVTVISWKQAGLDDLSRTICEALEEQPYMIDALSEKLGIPTGKLLVLLLQLEMNEIVEQLAGKIFRLKA